MIVTFRRTKGFINILVVQDREENARRYATSHKGGELININALRGTSHQGLP